MVNNMEVGLGSGTIRLFIVASWFHSVRQGQSKKRLDCGIIPNESKLGRQSLQIWTLEVVLTSQNEITLYSRCGDKLSQQRCGELYDEPIMAVRNHLLSSTTIVVQILLRRYVEMKLETFHN